MRGVVSLRRQRDIDRVFDEGRWRRLQTVAVGVYHRDDMEPTRAAFVAGRRTGSAVRRNRARRRLREAFRLEIENLAPGADVVLVARKLTGSADFQQLRADIREALQREGLLPSPDDDRGEQ